MRRNKTGTAVIAPRTPDADTIGNLASSVFDNGRRGNPKPGCDCFQCFGYCLVDQDEAMRARFEGTGRIPARYTASLDFSTGD